MSSKYNCARLRGGKEVPSYIAPEKAKDRESEGGQGGNVGFRNTVCLNKQEILIMRK